MEKTDSASSSLRESDFRGCGEKLLRSPEGDTLQAKKSLPPGKRKIFLLPVLLLVLFFFSRLSKLIFQIFLGALISALALPLEKFYEKKFSRSLSSFLSLFSFLLLIAGIFSLFLPQLFNQIALIGEELPRFFKWSEEMTEKALAKIRKLPFLSRLPLSSIQWQDMLSQMGTWLSKSLPALFSALKKTAEKISRAFISPVLAYYFLKDREMFLYQLSLLIPLKYRKRMIRCLKEARREAGTYLRGQILVALAVGSLTALGLFLSGVPAFLVLGLLMGICELIPYAGPLIGGVPIVLFSLSRGWMCALWALIVTIGVQQVESMVISPHLMSGALKLHPVYILLLLTAGGMLFGFSGLLLSLPLFVCLRGFLRVMTVTET